MTYSVQGACVDIDFLVLGIIDNNVYIISDDEATFVVDPSADAPQILSALGDRQLSAIVITHGHWDHVGAAAQLHEATGAPVIASVGDAALIAGDADNGPSHFRFKPVQVDRTVSEGDVVEIGNMRWRVIETPGHTGGSMCLYLDPAYGKQEGAPVLISGDTLFAGTHGRTDFEGSDPAAMSASLMRLAQLPDETIVLPGHNNLTTIGREKSWLQHGGIVR